MSARQSRQGAETDGNRTLSAQIENIVIAGAGQDGGRAAEALRAMGFQGAITMLGPLRMSAGASQRAKISRRAIFPAAGSSSRGATTNQGSLGWSAAAPSRGNIGPSAKIAADMAL